MKISIILATYKRLNLLTGALDSFCAMDKPEMEYEIIIADNEGSDLTRDLVKSYAGSINVKYLCEKTPGKNNALLAGLKAAKGSLIIFTDDDVVVSKTWISEYLKASDNYPDCSIFGGSVEPVFPPGGLEGREYIDLEIMFFRSAFGMTAIDLKEGYCSVGRIWGANMAVRKSVFDSGLTFDPNIGPKGNDYAMGSENEFLRRAERNNFKAVFLPSCIIKHIILPEQLEEDWLLRRAYRSGRGKGAVTDLSRHTLISGVPRYVYRKVFLGFLASIILGPFCSKKKSFALKKEVQDKLGFMAECKNRNRDG